MLGVHWKDWCWSWNSNTLATLCKELTHWKRLWCWEGLGAGGGGNDRGWDSWLASPTRRTWVWVNSGCWWWTRRPGMLWFMGSQRVGHDWATELNWANDIWCGTSFHMLLCHLCVFFGDEGFPGSSAGKESACSVGDLSSIPGLGRSPGEEKEYPLQYSGLENSMNCIVQGVARSWTWLSNFHFRFGDEVIGPFFKLSCFLVSFKSSYIFYLNHFAAHHNTVNQLCSNIRRKKLFWKVCIHPKIVLYQAYLL